MSRYILKQKDHLVYKPRAVKDITKASYTGLASAMPLKGLKASPVIMMVWRVAYFTESSEFGPRKPFWYLKASVTLQKKGELVRVV